MAMDRADFVLAALATGREFTPVQIQKLLFLLDKEIPTPVGGPHFQFRAYNYGPFDPEVYGQLEKLAEQGLVEIDYSLGTRRRLYRVSREGDARGTGSLATLSTEVRSYVGAISEWVRSLSFDQLVMAIYERYPEMRANSVFRTKPVGQEG